jgi:cytochrome P450
MVESPEVQAKAQRELDEVIGRGRLPNFSDRVNLLYMDTIYKELLRCHPAVPLGIPHSLTADDEYEGMRIPKGSIVLANVWCVPGSV